MVLWAAGLSYLLLALFYVVIDVIGLRFLAFPLVVIGMNAIVAYVAYHLVIPFDKISANLFGGLASHLGSAGPILLALATVLLVWLLLYHLVHRHRDHRDRGTQPLRTRLATPEPGGSNGPREGVHPAPRGHVQQREAPCLGECTTNGWPNCCRC